MLLLQPAQKTKGRQRLVAAATSTALVAGVGGLVLAGAPAANAADKTLDRSFSYTCRVIVHAAVDLDLNSHAVGVRAQVAVPTAVSRSQTIATRKTTITLSLPESLRSATVGLGGSHVQGESKDARIAVTAPGASALSVPIQNLKAANQAIPSAAPWTIKTVGDVPAIRVPASAHTAATISMPARFTVLANLTLAASTAPVTMTCTTTGNRTLGSIAINKNASKIAAKVSPKTVKAKKTKAKVAVKVTAGSPAASGKVTAKVGKKTVGKGTVRNGKATIKLKAFKKKGTYKVKLTYSGSVYAKAATKTIKVKVKK